MICADHISHHGRHISGRRHHRPCAHRGAHAGVFGRPAFGLCGLPLAFIIGAQLWLGYALLRGLAHVLRRGGLPCCAQSDTIPPGSAAFVVSSVGVSLILGMLVAIALSRLGFLLTLAVFVALGTGFGIACHLLARNGFLPVYDIESGPP